MTTMGEPWPRDAWVSETRLKYGPKTEYHPSVGKDCLACHLPFVVGDYTTLIPLGPGADPEARRQLRAGRPYNAVAIEIHWGCATGEDDE